ncbi:peptidyl-prolyl cis-trans isomerase [Aliidongia dinghuensis]|uniref:Parvulin-like PPIase n=1 Tax=Aliidongia dinghuensis TaxID=1867774 RepID=A0A8J2Z081_9PROT|nr:peptidylprolyl isomerase [Aliidongia dinghuensis]GGF43444.1 peptidyl-prolyl cis-trans isomerase [Aliidongia dinghuensis]
METVVVNGIEIPARSIASEMQFHPAPSQAHAWTAAATALVVRELLLQEARRLGVEAEPDAPNEEEALIAALLAREVTTPEPDETACRRYWTANPAKFRAPDVYEAAHILFPAASDDEAARLEAKKAAAETLALLLRDPSRFAALARERSACPSGAAGGLLGQQSRGDLVPELETFILELREDQICPVPVATRYGYHILRLDRLARGTTVPFEAAHGRIERELAGRSWQRAVSQYIRILAGRSQIDGLALDGAQTPLVQ